MVISSFFEYGLTMSTMICREWKAVLVIFSYNVHVIFSFAYIEMLLDG